MDIEDWRRKIDELNDKILALLNERAEHAIEIGRLKHELGLPVYVREREEAVLSQLRAKNGGPLTDAAVERLFLAVMMESRLLEQEDSGDAE